MYFVIDLTFLIIFSEEGISNKTKQIKRKIQMNKPTSCKYMILVIQSKWFIIYQIR
jgi:hypothetical protein